MKMKKVFCLGVIILGTNGFSKLRTALDVKKEYLECIKSKECQERHKVKIVTTWDIIQDYTKITSKNLEKIKLERKRKEEEKRKKEHQEFINRLKNGTEDLNYKSNLA